MDKLIEKLKALVGEAWSDEWADELKAAGEKAVADAVASAIDSEKAKRLKAKKQASDAETTIADLRSQLESAGQADEALAAALKKAGEAQAEAESLKAAIRRRDIADAARQALSASELSDGHKIPADRLGAALKLLDLDGVDVDESGAVVGLESKVDALKSGNAFLWQPPPEAKTSGNGGKRQGANPPPKGAGSGENADNPAAMGAELARMAFARRGGRKPEVRADGS